MYEISVRDGINLQSSTSTQGTRQNLASPVPRFGVEGRERDYELGLLKGLYKLMKKASFGCQPMGYLGVDMLTLTIRHLSSEALGSLGKLSTERLTDHSQGFDGCNQSFYPTIKSWELLRAVLRAPSATCAIMIATNKQIEGVNVSSDDVDRDRF